MYFNVAVVTIMTRVRANEYTTESKPTHPTFAETQSSLSNLAPRSQTGIPGGFVGNGSGKEK